MVQKLTGPISVDFVGSAVRTSIQQDDPGLLEAVLQNPVHTCQAELINQTSEEKSTTSKNLAEFAVTLYKPKTLAALFTRANLTGEEKGNFLYDTINTIVSDLNQEEDLSEDMLNTVNVLLDQIPQKWRSKAISQLNMLQNTGKVTQGDFNEIMELLQSQPQNICKKAIVFCLIATTIVALSYLYQSQ